MLQYKRGEYMKIDRLIGILTILLQKEKTTIPQLAQRFEVSSRTIQRDIDTICQAGIPIVSMQGYGGGLTIADGYTMDKTIVTKSELERILTGIQAVESILKVKYKQTLAEKFSAGKDTICAEQNTIVIDLASWYQDSLVDKIDAIRLAISKQEKIEFTYYSKQGEHRRIIEPYLIIFQWAAWYVYGYCLTKKDYSLFKLNRLWHLENTKLPYVPRPISSEQLNCQQYFETETIQLTARFNPSAQYRLIEEYGPDAFVRLENQQLLFQRSFVDFAYLLQWTLSFGDQIHVIEPPELIAQLQKHARNIQKQYE